MRHVPTDYFERLHEAERRHWWNRGMRLISWSLLGDRLERDSLRVLDAGCGTGVFLAALLDRISARTAAGVDIDPRALAIAETYLPQAEFRTASVAELPFEDASFDLIVLNDVLQHVQEDEVTRALTELRRVADRAAGLLVRTNGARSTRRERDDWRTYDLSTLGHTLAAAGFDCERLTYANTLGSLWTVFRRREPTAPTATTSGIPAGDSRVRDAAGIFTLRAEAAYLARAGRRLPYGHTLFALAGPSPGA